jgi:hypothetical protein
VAAKKIATVEFDGAAAVTAELQQWSSCTMNKSSQLLLLHH